MFARNPKPGCIITAIFHVFGGDFISSVLLSEMPALQAIILIRSKKIN